LSRVPFSPEISHELLDGERLAPQKLLAARPQVRHIAWEEVVAPAQLHPVARKEERRRVAGCQLVQEVLPVIIEGGARHLVLVDHVEAECGQRLRHRARVGPGLLELRVGLEVVVAVDADDERDALLGMRGRCCGQQRKSRSDHPCNAPHVATPPAAMAAAYPITDVPCRGISTRM
jgi:hypothetical protein